MKVVQTITDHRRALLVQHQVQEAVHRINQNHQAQIVKQKVINIAIVQDHKAQVVQGRQAHLEVPRQQVVEHHQAHGLHHLHDTKTII